MRAPDPPQPQPETLRGLAGLVLAAGASTRMGASTNKLVEEVEGRPLVAWAVDAMIEAGLDQVTVVVGFEAERVRASLRGRSCAFVSSPDWRDGMGSCLLYTSPSPRDQRGSRMPSSA